MMQTKIVFILLVGFLLLSSSIVIAEKEQEPPDFEVDVAITPQKINQGEKGQFLVYLTPEGGYCNNATYSIRTDDLTAIRAGIFNTYKKTEQITSFFNENTCIKSDVPNLGIYLNESNTFGIFVDNHGVYWQCNDKEITGWEKIVYSPGIDLTFAWKNYTKYTKITQIIQNETSFYIWCNKDTGIILQRPKATGQVLFVKKDPLSSWPQNSGNIWVEKDAVIGEHQIIVTLSCNNNDTWSYFTGTGKFYVTDWWTENKDWILPLIGVIIGGLITFVTTLCGQKKQRENQLWLKIVEEHTDRLKKIIEVWGSNITVQDSKKSSFLSDGNISFDEHIHEYPSKTKEIKFNFEDDLRFQDLMDNHLSYIKDIKGFSDLKKEWGEFKNGLKSYFDKCLDLFEEIKEDSIKETGLSLVDIPDTEGVIDKWFSRSIYNFVISKAEGSVNSEEGVLVKEHGEFYELYLFNGGRTIGKGDKSQMDKCKSIHLEMQKLPNYLEKAKDIIESKRKLEYLKQEIEKKLEKLILIQRLYGECEYIKCSMEKEKNLTGKVISLVKSLVKKPIELLKNFMR